MADAIYRSIFGNVGTAEEYARLMDGSTLPSHEVIATRTGLQILIGALFTRSLWKWYEARERAKGRPTHFLKRHEAPEWLQEAQTEHITDGFRRECSFCACCCTCGACHNETFNVWSHGMAAVWFANLAYFSDNHLSKATASATVVCMGSSAIAHQFGGINSYMNRVLFRFDRAGIAFDFWIRSLVLAILHFGNQKQFKVLRVYRILITMIGFGAMGSLFAGSAFSARTKFHILFLQMAIGTFPVLRELATSESKAIFRIIFKYLPLASIPAILGGIVFTNEFPEKYISDPALKDNLSFIGNGHNLMHVLVTISLFMAHRGMSFYIQEMQKQCK